MPLREKMIDDRWSPAYIDELTGHMTGMERAGIARLLTQTLGRGAHDAYLLTSEDGRPFGSLRGEGSAVAAYETYIRETFPGDADDIISLVVGYASGVENSSWAPMVQIVKEFLVRQRTAPGPDSYFWKQLNDTAKPWSVAKDDIAALRAKYLGLAPRGDEALRERHLRQAVITWHALTQLLLRHTTFPANNSVAETLTVVRTESTAALEYFRRVDNGAALTAEQIGNPSEVYDVPLTATRGALESSSLYTVKTIHGNVVTEAVVPHHRIFALYLTARPKSVGHQLSFFANDTENEVTFLPEGLSFRIRRHADLGFAAPTTVAPNFF
ncbi:hypothetical protein [Micromonospora rubida]|uniref:hypothetical protein n=1 Tax=Micromonospora rubida TaxID=2697657 RepID=UPI0013770AEC|nr:hypothetical protein [Micromonospora rubida]NBE81647.1 hypothetical protein [Micromonospora rubida]